MSISKFHQEVADIAPRVPSSGSFKSRPDRPAYTGQNKGLRRKYKAMKRAAARKPQEK